MTVESFLNYLCYSTDCPDEFSSPIRWAGMLKWYTTRTNEGYFDEIVIEEC